MLRPVEELFTVGPDSLARFLTRWYGPADRPHGTLPAGADTVPGPLRTWYDVTSRWSLPTRQNQLLTPDQTWSERDTVVFWVENQGVWLWGTRQAGDDPPVYDRENVPGAPWQSTGQPLSAFLLHVAVFEAIMTARHSAMASWLTPAQRDLVLAPLRPLPMPAWRWPAAGHRLHAGAGLLALAGPNGVGDTMGETTGDTTDLHEAWLAAQDPTALAYLAQIDGVDWDDPPG
jgi:hypothetical protein